MPCTFRHHATLFVAFLTTLLAFQAIGWLMAWDVARMEVHSSVQRVLAQNNPPVSSFTLALHDLPAFRVGKKEVRISGHLYDIRSMHPQGDSVRLELYHDRHEEQLFKMLGLMLLQEDNEYSPYHSIQIWLAKWLGSSFLMPQQPLLPQTTAAVLSHRAIFNFLSPAAQAIPGTSYPPPEGDSIEG